MNKPYPYQIAENNGFKGHNKAWWAGMIAGAGLVLFPEPATTATGFAIVTALLFVEGDESDKGEEK